MTPVFVLAGPDGVVLADGPARRFADLASARAALSRREVPILLGALPFDLSAPAALMSPERVAFGAALPPWPRTELPPVQVEAMLPAPQVHRARVAAAVSALRDPTGGLHKVVLARALQLTAEAPLDVSTLITRLAEDHTATAFFTDLSAAGPDYAGTALIGASPELLVARRGDVVTCKPFAGSAPRSADPDTDSANGAALAASAKNRHEHQLVVDIMREALEPLCSELQIAPEPRLSATSAVWHLSTPIVGKLRDPSTTALDLAVALHPTPAVGGVPTAAATDLITELEGDRGFYAGAVGWCRADGDGRWVVSIRCGQLSADRRTVNARAGGGIVAESDPDDEVAETTTKFKTILTALGVPQ
ncbi:isochorismate synthase [Mycobacterium sp. OTB74]|uniref:isochorismate synthase n=1 Tax=Mycobacterium sp. OTB74 TaxID=1853452 RepID=UPI0024752708|nr:isochorismate synthase [Mycobacterium sp. OTB74]MDH6242497.1 isochorismate synthase [Mycobacterium sp. OTB74]